MIFQKSKFELNQEQRSFTLSYQIVVTLRQFISENFVVRYVLIGVCYAY